MTRMEERPVTSDMFSVSEAPSLAVRLIDAEVVATGTAQVLAVLAPAPPREAASLAFRSVSRRVAARSSAALADSSYSWTKELHRHFSSPVRVQSATLAFAEPDEKSADPEPHLYPFLGVMLGSVDRVGLQGLMADPRVEDVHLAPKFSLIRPTQTSEAARDSGMSWGLQAIAAPDLWALGYTGADIVVGHLDTGVDAAHPALAGAIANFAEFNYLGKPVAGARPRDTDIHGTHTAGIIVGRKVGRAQFGVAPDAQLASAIVIEGGDVSARVLAAMNWAIGLGVRILNASLGLPGYSTALVTVTQRLRASGVLPVFAIGNDGPGTSRWPGNYVETLSVGASDERNGVGSFSGSQIFARETKPLVPDCVAPGVGVLSCIPSGKYAKMNGTSMAAPHVAGLAALLLQAAPSATTDQLEKAILDSCSLPPGTLPQRGNRGIPNGPLALSLLTSGATPSTLAAISVRKPKRKSPSRRKKPR